MNPAHSRLERPSHYALGIVLKDFTRDQMIGLRRRPIVSGWKGGRGHQTAGNGRPGTAGAIGADDGPRSSLGRP